MVSFCMLQEHQSVPDSEAALFYINDLAAVGGAAAGMTGAATSLSAHCAPVGKPHRESQLSFAPRLFPSICVRGCHRWLKRWDRTG